MLKTEKNERINSEELNQMIKTMMPLLLGKLVIYLTSYSKQTYL